MPPVGMRRAGAVAAAAFVTLGLSVAAPRTGAAASASATASLVAAGWSWHTAAALAGLPDAGAEPSNVPNGDVAVAAGTDQAGEPTKETYIAWDFGQVPASGVSAFGFTFTLDTADQQTQLAAQSPPPLEACRLTASFAAGSGSAWSARPAADCSAPVAGKFDATAVAYSFDLSAYASGWLSGAYPNNGVVIRPPAGYTVSAGETPFQLSAKGGSALAAEFSAGAPAAAPDDMSSAPAAGSSVVSSPPVAASKVSRTLPTKPALLVTRAPAATSVQPIGSGSAGLAATAAAAPLAAVAPPALVASSATVSPAAPRNVETAAVVRPIGGGVPPGFWLAAVVTLAALVGIGAVNSDVRGLVGLRVHNSVRAGRAVRATRPG